MNNKDNFTIQINLACRHPNHLTLLKNDRIVREDIREVLISHNVTEINFLSASMLAKEPFTITYVGNNIVLTSVKTDEDSVSTKKAVLGKVGGTWLLVNLTTDYKLKNNSLWATCDKAGK